MAIKLSLCWQGDKAGSQDITQHACGAANIRVVSEHGDLIVSCYDFPQSAK